MDDVDEQVTKIMRDPPIKLVAMQPPPSISMICDTRPVYRLKSSQILGFKNLFYPLPTSLLADLFHGCPQICNDKYVLATNFKKSTKYVV